MSELDRLSGKLNVTIPLDRDGYLGRECPESKCEGYFKIKPGTGLDSITHCICPYCGRKDNSSSFHTKLQIAQAVSIATQNVMEAISKDTRKAMEFISRPDRNGISMSVTAKEGRLRPLHFYLEGELETRVICDRCTLDYMVYGVFAYCPDCGQHNSLQTLAQQFEIVEKILLLASHQDGVITETLIEEALQKCVSAFDGFGSNLMDQYQKKAKTPSQAKEINFQNLGHAQSNIQQQFGVNILLYLSPNQWDFTVRCFQKRHVFSHKMGVVDKKYVMRSGDTSAKVGRRVAVTADEVRRLMGNLRTLATSITKTLESLP